MPAFYNEKNLTLPLDMILLENGYTYKKEKCSANHLTMRNDNDDIVVITRANNGHYLYFNPLDDRDKGNIYSFCKNRGVKIDDLLDESKVPSLEIKDLKHNINPSSLNNKVVELINVFNNELKELNYDYPNFFIMKRRIDESTMKPFAKLKRDCYQNICVPSYVLDSAKVPSIYGSVGGSGKNDNLEIIKFVNQCGFMKYLQSPIQKEGGVIKQLCYGKKGLEILKTSDLKQANVKNIIVCESIIDALSLFELKGLSADESMLCSTNGQISPNHYEILKHLAQNATNAEFVLGFDNDKKGQDFTQKAKEALKGCKISVEVPCLKDFNDDLMVGKLLLPNFAQRLENGFDKAKLETQIQASLIEPISYFLDKHSVLLPDALKRSYYAAVNAKQKAEFVAFKCEGYISKNHFKTLATAITKMQNFEQTNLKRGKGR